MFSFIRAEGLPAEFRAGSNASRHEFDCVHNVSAGDYCRICRVLMLPHIREYSVNFFFDRPSKAIESVGIRDSEGRNKPPQEFVDFALAFMSTPARSKFFVTTLYQNWAGIQEEFEEDVHAVVGSYIINAIPAESEDVDVDSVVDAWLKNYFGPLLHEIKRNESIVTVGDEKFEIINMTDAHTERLWGELF